MLTYQLLNVLPNHLVFVMAKSTALLAYTAKDFGTQSDACDRKTSSNYKQKLCNDYQSTLSVYHFNTNLD